MWHKSRVSLQLKMSYVYWFSNNFMSQITSIDVRNYFFPQIFTPFLPYLCVIIDFEEKEEEGVNIRNKSKHFLYPLIALQQAISICLCWTIVLLIVWIFTPLLFCPVQRLVMCIKRSVVNEKCMIFFCVFITEEVR